MKKGVSFDELFKAYFDLLKEEDVKSFDSPIDNKHLQNIQLLRLNRQEVKDSFLGLLAHFRYSVCPKMKDTRRFVYDPKLGGTIELFDPKYYEYEREYFEIIEKAERFYLFICDYDKEIAEEYMLMEKEKDEKLLKEHRLREWRKQPIYVGRPGKQLTINFDQ